MSLSASAAATRAHVIPLISELKMAELRQAHIVHTVNVGTNNDPIREKRKMEVPKADKLDIELILRTVDEFHDVASAGRLNLSTGPLKFAKFRECLGGSIRDQWDVVKANHANETNATFDLAIAEFIKKFLRESDLLKQKHYMDTAPKPYRVPVRELASCYQFLNNLMRWFPTANRNKPYDDNSLKFLLHTAMLQDWKDNFGRSNLNFSSSFEEIVTYFSDQEEIHDRRNSNNNNNNRGGRGRGRFQGNQGRGFQGRGYYRGAYQQGRGTSYYGGGYQQGRGGYTPNQGQQGNAAFSTPPNQYRRLNTPPSRVSTGSQGSNQSPGRFGGYPGRFGGGRGGGRFQRVAVQGTHYVDDSAGYEENPNELHHGQDNYLASSVVEHQDEDYQEEIPDQEAYFANGYEDDEEYYGEDQW